MSKAIPSDLEPLVLQKAAEGLTTRAISTWLLQEHSVNATHATVANLLKRVRTERADISKAVVREKLGASVARDIDRLELFVRKAMRIARTCEGKPVVWAKVAEQVRKFTEAKLKASGIEDPSEKDHDARADEERLVGKLARLITEASQGQDSGEPDSGGEA